MKKLIFIFTIIITMLSSFIVADADIEWSHKQEIELETIIPAEHNITIINHGNGVVLANNTSVYDTNILKFKRFSTVEIYLNPHLGYKISKVKYNNQDITTSINRNSFIITNLTYDSVIEVSFEEISYDEIPSYITSNISSDNFYNFTKSITGNISKKLSNIPNIPKTSDSTKLSIYLGIGGVSFILIFLKIKEFKNIRAKHL